ncbi:MAG TPA: PIN domain-containing protein [Stellaceae bacterium]|nr:PIN domain-containing protein [Stellaceae bacterium]
MSSFDRPLSARHKHRFDLVRRPGGPIAERIEKIGQNNVCASIIVTAELRYGVAKRGSARLTRQLFVILDAFDILPFEPPADTTYGIIRRNSNEMAKSSGRTTC